MADGPRAVGFESFKRNNPHVVKIASVWRGTPEAESWMNIFLDPDNKTVEYLEEDDHQIITFYRNLSEREIDKVENQSVVTPEPAPDEHHYKVIGVVHEHSDERMSHKVWHVKLGIPRWVPVGDRFGLCEYVLVDQLKENVKDDAGDFVYMTTSVQVTDENVEKYEDANPIYVAPTVLDVFEAMFAIGEIGDYVNEVP